MNPVQKYTKAGATHGYLCLEVVRFTFNNRQLNCGGRPLSSLGYSRHKFIVITHNKRTMEVVDNLYGITMEEPGISKSVNVNVKQQVAI